MLIYEVNLEISSDIFAKYSDWLVHHISQVLETKCFFRAEIFELDPSSGGPHSKDRHLTVHYHTSSESLLQTYLSQHAPRLRQDGIDQFGSKFKASRRVLLGRQSFGESK